MSLSNSGLKKKIVTISKKIFDLSLFIEHWDDWCYVNKRGRGWTRKAMRKGRKHNRPRPRYYSLRLGLPRPRISVYPATSGRETLETKLALLGAGCTTRLDCGHQIEQVFKIGHEQLKSSLNRSSYLWSASPRANLSRTSSNILSPRTVITCLMGQQEQTEQ